MKADPHLNFKKSFLFKNKCMFVYLKVFSWKTSVFLHHALFHCTLAGYAQFEKSIAHFGLK